MKMVMLVIVIVGYTVMGTHADAGKGDTCEDLAGTAEEIMRTRQLGIDMVDVAKVIENEGTESQLGGILIDAFEQPRYSLPENQNTAITDFKNKYFLACYKATTNE